MTLMQAFESNWLRQLDVEIRSSHVGKLTIHSLIEVTQKNDVTRLR